MEILWKAKNTCLGILTSLQKTENEWRQLHLFNGYIENMRVILINKYGDYLVEFCT